MTRFLTLLITLLLISIPASALETQPTAPGTSSANGILQLNGQFMIFPDNKLGNSIYFNKKKLLSRDDLTMVDIVAVDDGFIYHGLDESGKSVLGYTGSPDVKFIPLQGGFYHLITSQNSKKKLYWINGQRQIEDLLPTRNTGSGLVFNGTDTAVFYHIAKGETIETDEGRERYQYTFRLHVANTKTHQVRDLPASIKDFSLNLRLEWMDADTIKYTLGNGLVETMAIR